MKVLSVYRKEKTSVVIAIILAYICALFVSTLLHMPNVSAAPTGWNAGRIIEDWMMTANSSMSKDQIQSFLNSKVSFCDTYGTQPSEFGGGTRRQWAEARGHYPPYTCLKDYSENGKTSAQIIYDVAQEFTINPQVLIVLLQKEQSLVTDTWPLARQYRSATGYGCPDTAACDSQYYGFTNQVRWASRMFRAIMNDSPSWYTPYNLGENFIRYSPDASCGGSVVNIQNRATQALYNYTPYQPNQGALNAGWGTAYCGAYGNRNFYLYFTEWFNYVSVLQNGITMTNVTMPDSSPAKGQEITYRYRLTNNLSVSVNLNNVGVIGRLGGYTGQNRDFGWQGAVALAAGESREFTSTTTIQDIGQLYMWPAISYQGYYVQYNSQGLGLTSHTPNVSLTSPLTASTQNPVAGENVTFSATIKNNEDAPVQLSAAGIPIRFYDRWSYDTAWSSETLAAGASKVITGSVVFDKPGPYTAWVSALVGGEYLSLSPTNTLNTVTPSPRFVLTYTNPLPNTTPAVGETVSLSFKLKNTLPVPITVGTVGTVGRTPNSTQNHDFGWSSSTTFTPGEEKSFTFSRVIDRMSTLDAWVAVLHNGTYTHYSPYKFTFTPHLPNLTLATPIVINSGNPITLGQTVPVTVVLRNNEASAISVNAAGIPIRLNGISNYDTAWQGPISFARAGQSGDVVALNGNVHFDKPGTYTLWTSIFQNESYRTIGSPISTSL